MKILYETKTREVFRISITEPCCALSTLDKIIEILTGRNLLKLNPI